VSTYTQQYTANTGDTFTAARWNGEFAALAAVINGDIDNANIAAAAGIAYSKLDLSLGIVNADVSASAAVAYSKLNLTGSVLSGDLAFTAIDETSVQTMSNKTLTKPVLDGLTLGITTATSSGSQDLDCTSKSYFEITLNGSTVLTISNQTANQPVLLHLKQDSTGTRLVTWPANVRWAGGATPTLTTTGNKVDTFGFILRGSINYGYIVGQNIATS